MIFWISYGNFGVLKKLFKFLVLVFSCIYYCFKGYFFFEYNLELDRDKMSLRKC